MKAAVYHKPKDVRCENVPDPRIEHPRDAIVRITATAICGSDLHIYNGLFPQFGRMVMGHEFVGVVIDVGHEIRNLKRGDRVVVPACIACGRCFFCTHQMPVACEESNPEHWGAKGGTFKEKGGAMFGFTNLYGGVAGGQAEAVRVPFADVGPRRIPERLSDDQAIFLSDILPSGWAGVDWAGVKGGETVVVFGCGPVGLMALKAAWLRGAERVIGVDVLPYRLRMAERVCGVETLNPMAVDVADAIIEMTHGRGADVCIDAVGMEAHRGPLERLSNIFHLQMGTISVLKNVLSSVRRGGHVSILGVYGTNYSAFPLGQWFDKGVTIRAGQVPVHVYIDKLIDLLVSRQIRTDDIITHPLNLSDVSHAYGIFADKQDGCVKVVMRP